jgi:hypothetical protein
MGVAVGGAWVGGTGVGISVGLCVSVVVGCGEVAEARVGDSDSSDWQPAAIAKITMRMMLTRKAFIL